MTGCTCSGHIRAGLHIYFTVPWKSSHHAPGKICTPFLGMAKSMTKPAARTTACLWRGHLIGDGFSDWRSVSCHGLTQSLAAEQDTCTKRQACLSHSHIANCLLAWQPRLHILCRSVAHALRLPQPEPAGPARNRSQLRWSLKQSLLLAGWAWKTKPDQLKASLGAARASGACHMLPNSACQFEAKVLGKHCRSSNYGLHRLPMASIHESRLDLTHQTTLTEMLGLQTAGSQFSI